jgi:hypothetical protein
VTWISYGEDGNTNSKGKCILCIDDSACHVNNWSVDGFVGEYARHRFKEGQGIAGKALQSNIHIQHDISVLDPAEFPHADYRRRWWFRIFEAGFAIRLTSTHPSKDDYVLEFLLPKCMKETSERELLINKVLRTLQRKCLKLWKVWVRELNEASGSEVRLDIERMPSISHEDVSRLFQLPSSDDERMPNIPHEARVVQLTMNLTSNQEEETHEPLEQVLFYTAFMSFFSSRMS